MSIRECGERYRGFIEGFLEWANLDYETLFTTYLEARRSADPRDSAIVTGKVVQFYNQLRLDGCSPGYAKNHVKAISSFFAENGLTLEFTKAQRKQMPDRKLSEKDTFTKDELKAVIASATSPRTRCIVHVLKDSGMAVSDAADLTVGDVAAAIENGDKFCAIEYRRNKTGISGTPCLGPEALDAIREWLRWRRNDGLSCAPREPLFIGVRDATRGVPSEGHDLGDTVKYLIEKSGLSDKRLSAHSLRIYNASQLESAGMNKNLVYRIQGRIIPDSGRSYSKGEVLSSYIKAYESLAVGGTKVIEIQDSRVTALEAKNAELEAKLTTLISEKVAEAIKKIELEKPKI